MLRNKHSLQSVGGFGVCVLDRVKIALGRSKIAVTEPRLHLLKIHAGIQQQGCRGVPQTVKLADFEAVSLQKLPELLGRRDANIFQKFCGTIGRGNNNEEGKSGHS